MARIEGRINACNKKGENMKRDYCTTCGKVINGFMYGSWYDKECGKCRKKYIREQERLKRQATKEQEKLEKEKIKLEMRELKKQKLELEKQKLKLEIKTMTKQQLKKRENMPRKFLTVEDARILLFKVKKIFPDATNTKNSWHNGKKIIHLNYWIASDTVGGLKVILRGSKAMLIKWNSNGKDEILFECKMINGMYRYLKKHYGKEPDYTKKIERTVS